MTLQEAHELQRKELMSLRAENKRLKKQTSGLFPVEEKETLERHVRHLEQVIKTMERRHASARANWKLTDDHRFDLLLEILDLKDQVSALTVENEALRIRAEKAEAEVLMLNGTNRRLEKKIHTNFENSSLPSSALPFRKKVPNSRKPSGRKPGAQHGHRSHTAAKLIPTEAPIHLPVPEGFINDPNIYPTGKTITKQLVNLRVQVSVQEFVADEFRNRLTGSSVHAPFPVGVTNPVNYGPSVKALAFLLNNYYNVSVSKTKQCISDITKGIVSLATGTICNLSKEFSVATRKDRAKIFSLLTHADALYSDATVSNINGTRKAVILCTDKKHVLFQHLDHKGHDGLSQTPVKEFEGTLIHDHDRSYYAYGKDHQECIAHVLRYLVGAMENEPDLTWHKQMHKHLRKMIHLTKKHKDGMPTEMIKTLTQRYEEILSTAELEYQEHPPAKEYMDGFNLQKRLREFQTEHLYFLSHPYIDYTNNISERELRKFKRKQKQAVVLRSDSGAQYICDALTIIETSRMQNRNIYDTVESAFVKEPKSDP